MMAKRGEVPSGVSALLAKGGEVTANGSAEQLGVSNAATRSALQKLYSEGTVHRRKESNEYVYYLVKPHSNNQRAPRKTDEATETFVVVWSDDAHMLIDRGEHGMWFARLV